MDFKQIEQATMLAIDETNHSISLLERLIAEADEASWDLLLALNPDEIEAISFHRSYVRGSSTYDELKSAGELRFIQSESLRSELADFERTRAIHVSAARAIEVMRDREAPNISSRLNLLFTANESEDENVTETIVMLRQKPITTNEFQTELGGLLSQYLTVKYWHEQTLEDVRQVLMEFED